VTEIDLDAETARAVDALVHRLRNRADDTSDEWLAREFMAALRGQGWRPTPAKAVGWREANRPVLSERPMSAGERSEWLAKARADCEAATERHRGRATGPQSRLDETTDRGPAGRAAGTQLEGT
jgi:hypothetical protein